MPHIQGTVKAIYDNRLRDGKPNKFPNFKIIVDDLEATLWSAITPVCKKGDLISLHYQYSKKNGSAFVLSDDNKNPKIQVLPQTINNTLPNNDMPQSEKEWLSAPADAPHDFTPMQYEKDGILDKKGLTIFVQGMLQAGIKSDQIKVSDKQGLELVTTDLIDLYKRITK